LPKEYLACVKNNLKFKFDFVHIEICMFYLLAIFIFLGNVLSASLNPCIYNFHAGPEVYHLRRVREGGTRQDGCLEGVRLGFDRIKRYAIYIGADYLYASGKLEGGTATGRRLTSDLTDRIVELRLGYTLQQKDPRRAFITAFAGYGYFRETNEFYTPSPLPCTFTDTFNFFSVGFLSGVNFNPLLSMGINFKLRFMQDGKSEVSDDPVYDTVLLNMQDEIHVRLDVPILFSPCKTRLKAGLLLAPFFEYRHFGGREGFPFNFKDTKFYLYGAHFGVTCGF
jgi:hypothetical protein